MSVYFKKGKGWRCDFTLDGRRITEAWFKTKGQARSAETRRRREEIERAENPPTPTDMDFLELINRRLDYVKAYCSDQTYRDYVSMGRRWVKRWGPLACEAVTSDMIEQFALERSKVSSYTANKEIRSLRATFNYGIKRGLVLRNPTHGLDFLPEGTKLKYVPPMSDIDKVIEQADPDARDYLWTIRDTMARVNEINQLKWADVDLSGRFLVLYTRKKRGSRLTPRKVPMTDKVSTIMERRQAVRERSVDWVFWHRYYSRKLGRFRVGSYRRRKRLMRSLCQKAGVRPFGFHALRHAGASMMERYNVPLGSIQRILGHSSRTTTEIYLHSVQDAEFEAIRIYERVRISLEK